MTAPHFHTEQVTIWHGDCLHVMRQMSDNSVDALVTDPPYGLSNTDPTHVVETLTRWLAGDRDYIPATGGGFMGNAWDAFVPPVAVWDQALRVLKPGGHVLCFAGTRTVDLMTLALRLAGFEIRDSIAWLYGSGFPKSLDVSKAIDKMAGAEREIVGQSATVTPRQGKTGAGFAPGGVIRWGDEHYPWDDAPPEAVAYYTERAATRGQITAPATPDADRWQGWGTALKPSHEPVICARKPLQTSGILAEIGSHLDRLERECRHDANGAGPSSAPTRPASPEAKTATAPAHAATPPAADPGQRTATGTADGSPAQTDTSAAASTAATSSNTVTSWRAYWVELCEATSTSTTATTSETTTALRTLSSSIASLTATNMHHPATNPPGLTSTASAVDALFVSAVYASRATRALSAAAPATSPTLPSSPDGAVSRFEPVVVARKPLAGTVAANVLAYGTGALNIDATRIGTSDNLTPAGGRPFVTNDVYGKGLGVSSGRSAELAGRWPANVVLDVGMAAALDTQSGETVSRFFKAVRTEEDPCPQPGDASTTAANTSAGSTTANNADSSPTDGSGNKPTDPSHPATRSTTATATPSTTTSATSSASPPPGTTTTTLDFGSITESWTESRNVSANGAAPTSPSTSSRSAGLAPSRGIASPAPSPTAATGSPATVTGTTPLNGNDPRVSARIANAPRFYYTAKAGSDERPNVDGVAHPTVKSLELMQFLVRLVTPPGGVVLEPFAGSGTTVEACLREGFRCIAIEREASYLPLIMQRVSKPHAVGLDFGDWEDVS